MRETVQTELMGKDKEMRATEKKLEVVGSKPSHALATLSAS